MQIKYTNKSLFKIERHFDNKPFFNNRNEYFV